MSGLRVSPGALMLGALVLVILALALDSYRLPLIFGALALFALGYLFSMQRRIPRRISNSQPRTQVYWRGAPVERRAEARSNRVAETPRSRTAVLPFRDSWAGRMRRWFRGR